VDPVPDPLLLRKSGRAGNRTRASGSVVRNSDFLTTNIKNLLYRYGITALHVSDKPVTVTVW
jgi:hypothetical protein